MVYSTRRFVVCLSVCHFVLVFFSPFSTAISSLGEERANLSVFRTFVRFVLVWICWFPLPLGVWEGLRFVIVALPGLFSYLFLLYSVFPKDPQLGTFGIAAAVLRFAKAIKYRYSVDIKYSGLLGLLGSYITCMR